METAPIRGLHHVTAIAGEPQRNLDFYTEVLGMRLVKLTVNFDDPKTYHFYFGDEQGNPGTILTFFPWEGVPRGRHGTGQATVTAFSVPEDSLEWWKSHLDAANISTGEIHSRFQEKVLPFEDPDGMTLELVAEPSSVLREGWRSGSVPAEFAVRGLHSVTLTESSAMKTAALLTETLGFSPLQSEGNRRRYGVEEGNGGAVLDIVEEPTAKPGNSGAGTVHHIAFRVDDDAAQEWRRKQLVEAGYPVSPVMDRTYFHSIYFREPGGVLFEIATDNPGFTTDESLENLGTTLRLPEQYERYRNEIEKTVKPLVLPVLSSRKGA